MNGPYTAVVGSTLTMDDTLITCPTCGAVRGLAFTAFPEDRTVVVTCPAKHTWDEPRVTGRLVEDLWCALTDQPTRSNTLTIDGEPQPRADCGTCDRLQARINDHSQDVEWTENDEQHQRAQDLWAQAMGDWASHLAEHFTDKDTP